MRLWLLHALRVCSFDVAAQVKQIEDVTLLKSPRTVQRRARAAQDVSAVNDMNSLCTIKAKVDDLVLAPSEAGGEAEAKDGGVSEAATFDTRYGTAWLRSTHILA